MNNDLIPKQIQKYFKDHKINFEVSIFEETYLNELYSVDEKTLKKLYKNVTNDLIKEIDNYIKNKKNLRFSCMGETRTSKTLSMFVIVNHYTKKVKSVDFNKDIEKIVCGNQIEYREKLKNAKFQDFYLIDENFFSRNGLGSNIEHTQLKDYNAIIAKKNIGNIFINPELFLDVGSVLGFSTYGIDYNNWLSRLLVYKFKNTHPFLVGYCVLDVGRLFLEYKCFLYKFIGGCNNTKKIKYEDIPKDLIKYSKCLKKDYDLEIVKNHIKECPFYNYCNHPLNRYEHKKDKWINSSMVGTLDNRTYERYKISLEMGLDLLIGYDEEKKKLKYDFENKKELKLIVKLRFHKYSNTKIGIAETEELIDIIITNSNLNFLVENLHTINDKDLLKKYFNHSEVGEMIQKKYKEYIETLKTK